VKNMAQDYTGYEEEQEQGSGTGKFVGMVGGGALGGYGTKKAVEKWGPKAEQAANAAEVEPGKLHEALTKHLEEIAEKKYVEDGLERVRNGVDVAGNPLPGGARETTADDIAHHKAEFRNNQEQILKQQALDQNPVRKTYEELSQKVEQAAATENGLLERGKAFFQEAAERSKDARDFGKLPRDLQEAVAETQKNAGKEGNLDQVIKLRKHAAGLEAARDDAVRLSGGTAENVEQVIARANNAWKDALAKHVDAKHNLGLTEQLTQSAEKGAAQAEKGIAKAVKGKGGKMALIGGGALLGAVIGRAALGAAFGGPKPSHVQQQNAQALMAQMPQQGQEQPQIG
jgi:hypothetical protein